MAIYTTKCRENYTPSATCTDAKRLCVVRRSLPLVVQAVPLAAVIVEEIATEQARNAAKQFRVDTRPAQQTINVGTVQIKAVGQPLYAAALSAQFFVDEFPDVYHTEGY